MGQFNFDQNLKDLREMGNQHSLNGVCYGTGNKNMCEQVLRSAPNQHNGDRAI